MEPLPMDIQIVTSKEGFRSLKDDWDRLMQTVDEANVFMSFSWLYSWYLAYGEDADIRIIVIRHEEGRLIAVAPLMIVSLHRFGWNYQCLNFLGDGTNETNHMNFILDRRYADETLKIILNEINANLNWDILFLNMFSKNPILKDNLQNFVRQNKYYFKNREIEYAECIFPDTFQELIQTMQPRFRTKLRSTRKKINERYDVEFGYHSSGDEAPPLDAFFEMHNKRWEKIGRNGTFMNDKRKQFYRFLSESFLEKGWLRFFYLKLDGKIVAEQYCFIYKNKMYLLQEGFDVDLEKLNVGNVLRSYVFE